MRKIFSVLASLFLLVGLLALSSCNNNVQGPPPNHPLSISAKLLWGNDIYDDEVAIDFTITNNQDKIVTDVSIVLFYKIVFTDSDLRKPFDLRRMSISNLSLSKGESYNRILSFGNIQHGILEAESVQGELFSIYTQFADGSSWGNTNLSYHDVIRAQGVEIEITNIFNPKRFN